MNLVVNILADHCLPGKTIKLLRVRGYNITTLRELNKSAVSDKEVIQIAKKRDAVLITADLDFGNVLVYPPQHYQGIIVLRMNTHTEDIVNMLLDIYLSVTDVKDMDKKLIIIDSKGIRIRS